jgi:hypothetical protein
MAAKAPNLARERSRIGVVKINPVIPSAVRRQPNEVESLP